METMTSLIPIQEQQERLNYIIFEYEQQGLIKKHGPEWVKTQLKILYGDMLARNNISPERLFIYKNKYDLFEEYHIKRIIMECEELLNFMINNEGPPAKKELIKPDKIPIAEALGWENPDILPDVLHRLNGELITFSDFEDVLSGHEKPLLKDNVNFSDSSLRNILYLMGYLQEKEFISDFIDHKNRMQYEKTICKAFLDSSGNLIKAGTLRKFKHEGRQGLKIVNNKFIYQWPGVYKKIDMLLKDFISTT